MVAVAVVDDDAEARACLQQCLQRFAGEQQIDITITAFASAVDLLHHYRPVYDLIFVTNMAQLAIRGYEVEALDVVVKPVDYPSFAMGMRMLSSRAVYLGSLGRILLPADIYLRSLGLPTGTTTVFTP